MTQRLLEVDPQVNDFFFYFFPLCVSFWVVYSYAFKFTNLIFTDIKSSIHPLQCNFFILDIVVFLAINVIYVFMSSMSLLNALNS